EVKNEFGPDVETHWFHHRCHRAKATDKYLLMSRTGIEFLDISENHWTCHHWVRGGCLYGIMPCNGMVYTPAHDCACYMESKQFGFNALAPASPTRRVPKNVPDAERLERGPAYGQAVRAAAGAGEWPTYRHDGARSGMTDVPVPTGLKQTWETELGGTLSSVVIGEGKLFVASVEDHTVHALDAGSGEPVWSYTTGGRVDSPPTIYEGRALFGSADGWVYCLRAADGELIWRFRAAPDDRKLMAFEQLESVWPVHGSVLVQDGSVYCVAGRSMFVDGGLRFLHLDPETGRKLSETILDDRDPETGDNLQMYVKGLNMTVALPDVLSSDGTYVYMRSMPFDMEGARQRIAYLDVKQQRGEDAHLFSPTGFLDGSWWHRSYWIYGRSMASGAGGYYQAGRVAPAGRIMAFDDENVYGFGRKPQYYRWTTPLEYHLFATNREPPEAQAPARRGEGSWVSVAISDSLNPASKPLAVEAWARPGKKGGVVLARGGPANGYALFVDKGKPHFAVRATSELGSVNGQEDVVGKWVHLAGVLTADKKLQLYVNGELAASGPATGLLASNPAQALEIGADDGGGVGDYASPFGFAGAIDEARVYYGTLTAGEIGTHYSTPGDTAAQNATLALHHTYDDGKATDLSGNENDGIVESADPVPGKLGGALRFKGTRRRGMRQLPYIVEHHWSHEIPLHVRAMVLARERLFIAGPPDLVDEEEAQQVIGDPETQAKLAEQVAAFEGKQGAMLWAVSVADGKRLAEYQLESMPRWDGMAAAGGRLYVSTADGNVLCLAGA
ncbi:MAG: PQQ-binding-like beta-propeller repeat protein, partial [Armatimonadota bacterium]